MKKETQEYLFGERNATRDEFILSRERVRGSEYISLSLPDREEPIYRLWTRKKIYRKPIQPVGEIIEKARPKHTGGKRPYIMLMQDQSDRLYKLSLAAAGFLMKLMGGGFVEWDTGRLIDRRSKKPLTVDTIRSRFQITQAELKAVLKELKLYDIVRYDRKQRSYFLDKDLAKKGAGSNADKD